MEDVEKGEGKLTGLVNIAVFAAFRCGIGRHLRSNAEFKPRGANGQLDVSCYGRQKRQEVARNGNEMATTVCRFE